MNANYQQLRLDVEAERLSQQRQIIERISFARQVSSDPGDECESINVSSC